MKKIHLLLFPAVVAGASLLTSGIANADNVFVSNNGDDSILEIASGSSSPTVFIHDTTDLNGPTGVAFNSSGDLFVANNGPVGGGFVAEFSPTGTFIGDVATGLSNPRGLAFDSAGNLYVTNQSGGSIVEIPVGGSPFVLTTGFNFPNGLAYSNGNLYVANAGTGAIEQISLPSGSATVPVFATGVNNPNGLAFLGSTLLEADTGTGNVLEFNSAGTEIGTFASTGYSKIHGLAVDSSDDVWVSDEGANVVLEYNSSGTLLQTIDGFSGPNFITTETVPEPSTYALMLGGLGALLFFVLRKKSTV